MPFRQKREAQMNTFSEMTRTYLPTRRSFLGASAATITAGLCASLVVPQPAHAADASGLDIIGPKPGYSPQIGTLVSMLTWMLQMGIGGVVGGLTRDKLDYLFDSHA